MLLQLGLDADTRQVGLQLLRQILVADAGDRGDLGQQLAPVGKLAPGEAFSAFQAQARALLLGKPDLFILGKALGGLPSSERIEGTASAVAIGILAIGHIQRAFGLRF